MSSYLGTHADMLLNRQRQVLLLALLAPQHEPVDKPPVDRYVERCHRHFDFLGAEHACVCFGVGVR